MEEKNTCAEQGRRGKKEGPPFSRTNKQANSVLISVLTAVKTIKRISVLKSRDVKNISLNREEVHSMNALR